MNISSLFFEAAKNYPKQAAIIRKGNTISYGELSRDVIATASYFKESGIKKGDRVLVFVPMSIDLYRSVLALFYIGATAVFLDEWVSIKRLTVCCKLADCKGFIGVPKARFYGVFIKAIRRIPIKLKLSGRSSLAVSQAEVNEDTSALITFTTGSTGVPKAADRTHYFLKAQFDALIDEIDPKPSDVDMPVLPIVLFVNLGVGCTSVIPDFKMTKPEATDFSEIANLVNAEKVNRITASPFFIKSLAQSCIEQKTHLNNLEKIFTGGAPVFPAEAELYLKAFPKTNSVVAFGSTEAEPMSSISAKSLVEQKHLLSKGLPVGEVYHACQIRIVKISEKAIPTCTETALEAMTLSGQDIGEIIVAGPHVLKRYYNNDEAFEQNKIICGGEIWHRTGDSGFLENGELLLTGRCKQLIKAADGFRSPFLVEHKLQEIEGISMGTIVAKKGKTILVVESDLAEEVLQDKIADLDFDELLRMKKIPRDPRHNSKIDYGAL